MIEFIVMSALAVCFSTGVAYLFNRYFPDRGEKR